MGPGNFNPNIPIIANKMTIRIKQKLAEGGYAFVFLAEDVETGAPCIVKKTLSTTPHTRHSSSTELSILKRFSHPNIIQLLDHVMSATESLLVLEYCPGGSLLDLLQNAQVNVGYQLGESTALRIFQDVALAVRYIHKEGFVHRDIKLENILRSRNGVWKLCDFGSSVKGNVDIGTGLQRANEEEVIQRTTTQMYRAPEMADLFMSKELTSMVDIWALGCILYALCFLRHPFETSSNLAIVNSKIKFPKSVSSSKQLQVVACTKALMMGCSLPTRACPKPQQDISRGEDIGSLQSGLGPTGKKMTLMGIGKEETHTRKSRKPAATNAELDPSSVAARRLRNREGKNQVEDGEFERSAPTDSWFSTDVDLEVPPPAWTVNDNTKAPADGFASDPSMVFQAAAPPQHESLFQDYKIVRNNPCPEVQEELEGVPGTLFKQCDMVPHASQSDCHEMQMGSSSSYYSPPAAAFAPPLQSYSTELSNSGVISNVDHCGMISNSPCGTSMLTTPEQAQHASSILQPVQTGVLQGRQPSLMPAQVGPPPVQCSPIAAAYIVPAAGGDNLYMNTTGNTLRGGGGYRIRPISLPSNYRVEPVVFNYPPCEEQKTHQRPNSSRAASISMMNATVAREHP